MLGDTGRQCFVMMPFGTKQGINFDKIFEDLIQPIVESPEVGLVAVREDMDPTSGPIHQSMIGKIIDSPVVIADITTSNPNVLYELGVRHALRKKSPYSSKVKLICRKNVKSLLIFWE